MAELLVHAAGAAIYFVFFLLLLAASQVPRSQPGVIWWALATLAAAAARLSMLLLDTQHGEIPQAFWFYSGFFLLEKMALLYGCWLFFQPSQSFTRGGLFIGIGVIWYFCQLLLTPNRLAFDMAFSIYNCGALLIIGLQIWQSHTRLPTQLQRFAAIASLILALHWTGFVAGMLVGPSMWQMLGFSVGTLLALVLYFALLASVFTLFRQRLVDSEEQAMAMAFEDPLTGLNNKRYVDVLFEQALLLANRPHQLLALLYIDLDHFKPINDEAGHQVGDLVLKETALRLRSCLRSTDICARVGGDEFVVIATQLETAAGVTSIAEKLQQQLNRPMQIGEHVFQVGASIGISLYPEHGQDLLSLLEKADQAMYQVKKMGRGGCQVYQSMETQVER